MAVYTDLGAAAMERLLGEYDVGALRSAKGIAEGVSNSNWLIETAEGRFILTMYERRIDLGDLPYFLDLLDHLSAHDCPVPRTIHTKSGDHFLMVDGKAVALIEYLPGISPDRPSAEQARTVGGALARMHLAGHSFEKTRPNTLGPQSWIEMLDECSAGRLSEIDPELPDMLTVARRTAEHWPSDLPQSVIHSDLFPDNVLLLGERVSGMIDFYFACNDAMAYDLAVTHAAWSFDARGAAFEPKIGGALVEGYEAHRPLDEAERAALPLLAQGACLRFIASRALDWIETPRGALVVRKDPTQFVRRLKFYAERGEKAFTPSPN